MSIKEKSGLKLKIASVLRNVYTYSSFYALVFVLLVLCMDPGMPQSVRIFVAGCLSLLIYGAASLVVFTFFTGFTKFNQEYIADVFGSDVEKKYEYFLVSESGGYRFILNEAEEYHVIRAITCESSGETDYYKRKNYVEVYEVFLPTKDRFLCDKQVRTLKETVIDRIKKFEEERKRRTEKLALAKSKASLGSSVPNS